MEVMGGGWTGSRSRVARLVASVDSDDHKGVDRHVLPAAHDRHLLLGCNSACIEARRGRQAFIGPPRSRITVGYERWNCDLWRNLSGAIRIAGAI